MTAAPHYYERDVLYLLRRVDALRLGRIRSARSFLRDQVEAGRECSASLRGYPSLRIEALEFYYACLFSLAALDADLIADLCRLGWRGVVWAAFLAALAPGGSYAPVLRAAMGGAPQNRWLVALALHRIEGGPPLDGACAEIARLIDELGVNLEVAVRPEVALRRSPTGAEAELLAREREEVRSAYHRGGLVAAQAALAGTRWATYLLPYPAWIQTIR